MNNLILRNNNNNKNNNNNDNNKTQWKSIKLLAINQLK